MVMQGRGVTSSSASSQFRSGNNAAINGYAASARTEKIWNGKSSSDAKSRAIHSEAKAYERSGWEQERTYQQQKKNMWLGK
jgi:hypothetical protein